MRIVINLLIRILYYSNYKLFHCCHYTGVLKKPAEDQKRNVNLNLVVFYFESFTPKFIFLLLPPPPVSAVIGAMEDKYVSGFSLFTVAPYGIF